MERWDGRVGEVGEGGGRGGRGGEGGMGKGLALSISPPALFDRTLTFLKKKYYFYTDG